MLKATTISFITCPLLFHTAQAVQKGPSRFLSQQIKIKLSHFMQQKNMSPEGGRRPAHIFSMKLPMDSTL